MRRAPGRCSASSGWTLSILPRASRTRALAVLRANVVQRIEEGDPLVVDTQHLRCRVAAGDGQSRCAKAAADVHDGAACHQSR